MPLTRIPVDLGPGVRAWFTGRSDAEDPAVGRAGNLSHRRPHVPERLAADRREAFAGLVPGSVHLLRQVHGAGVAAVTDDTAPGRELPDVDAAVTQVPGRALAVLTADCVPLLLAGRRYVGVAHAGRLGVAAGVVPAVVAELAQRGEDPATLRAAIGPAIGGCCYEVPEDLRAEVADVVPQTWATTDWGTPALDLRAGVAAQLVAAGVVDVRDVGICTRCDRRFFSHRRDPDTGRQAGVVVLAPDVEQAA